MQMHIRCLCLAAHATRKTPASLGPYLLLPMHRDLAQTIHHSACVAGQVTAVNPADCDSSPIHLPSAEPPGGTHAQRPHCQPHLASLRGPLLGAQVSDMPFSVLFPPCPPLSVYQRGQAQSLEA